MKRYRPRQSRAARVALAGAVTLFASIVTSETLSSGASAGVIALSGLFLACACRRQRVRVRQIEGGSFLHSFLRRYLPCDIRSI